MLYRYKPRAKQTINVPVLVAYGLVGRYTMTDLQEDRSLVRNLLAQGVDLYAVDWGNPTRSDRWLTFDDYVDGYLDDCVEHICRAHGIDQVNLLGICEGGVFTALLRGAAPRAREEPDPDDHADRLPRRPGRRPARTTASSTCGRAASRRGRRPADRGQRQPARRADELRVLDDDAGRDADQVQRRPARRHRRREEAAELPAHGEVARRPSAPPRRGRQAVAEGPVPGQQAGQGRVPPRRAHGGPGDITMPVLNVYAQDDHIIPPKTSQALRGVVGTKDYSEIGLPGGHVGVFVSGKSQGVLGKGIVDWLRAATPDGGPRRMANDTALEGAAGAGPARVSRAWPTPSGARRRRAHGRVRARVDAQQPRLRLPGTRAGRGGMRVVAPDLPGRGRSDWSASPRLRRPRLYLARWPR